MVLDIRLECEEASLNLRTHETIGAGNWQIIVGLVIGSSLAAPFAAHLAQRFSIQMLLVMVGSVIILMNLRTLCPFFQ